MSRNQVAVCFVCLGNICRSPTAEGVFLSLVEERGLAQVIRVDSAGTGGWHVGEVADKRARATARQRGIELPSRARQFIEDDFVVFDYVLAMDSANRMDLHALAPDAEARDKVYLFRDFDPAGSKGADVPDPYYGGPRGFDDVFDLCESSARGLLDHLSDEFDLS